MILKGSAGAFALVICLRTSCDRSASFLPSSASFAVKGRLGACYPCSVHAKAHANQPASRGLFRTVLLLLGYLSVFMTVIPGRLCQAKSYFSHSYPQAPTAMRVSHGISS